MFALLLAAVVTSATPCTTVKPGSDWVCVDGGWRPANQAPPPSPEPVPDSECGPLPDPYSDPEKVIEWNACHARQPRASAVPTFLLGHIYAFAYGELLARVISLGTDEDGVQVVTVRWLASGAIDAFRTPPTKGGESVWRLVR